MKWSQLVRTFLKGKGKLSHLLGTGPKKGDPRFDAWDEEDSMVMSWLWNSMLPEISDTFMFLPTSKEIWEAAQQTYSKVSDAARVFEIKSKISDTKQGDRSVTEYANLLKNLWQEMDHYRCIEMKCSDDAAVLKNFIEKDRTYDFLAGLNIEFDQVRIQILGKEELPSLNETISIINAEESRRGMMLYAQPVEESAMEDMSHGDVNSSGGEENGFNKEDIGRLRSLLDSLEKSKGGVTALIVYVDDIIVTGNDSDEKEALRKYLAKEFKIKDLGKLKPSDTPIEPNHRLAEFIEGEPTDKGMYQRLVGKLIYLSHKRPDIAYAVSVVSQFMQNPKDVHLHAVYQILQYLKGSPGRGILFRKGTNIELEAYTDADYAGSLTDRRSTSGYCTFLGGNLVTWRSKKQPVVARSSSEVEFRSMAQAESSSTPSNGSLNIQHRLGPAGLALHYANIVLQIDSIVARSNAMPPNTRDTLYQSLPPSIKSPLRAKLHSFHVKEELTVTEIKAEMEKTLHWLVPISINTAKAHHGFGWVGEWANTGSEVNRKPTGLTDIIRIDTLHHADKQKTEAYILELMAWLNHLVSRSKVVGNGGSIRSPIKSLTVPTDQENNQQMTNETASASSPLPKVEDQEIIYKERTQETIRKIQDFDETVKSGIRKHDEQMEGNGDSPTRGSNNFFPAEGQSSSIPVVGLDIKAMDVLCRVDYPI
ncbi:hypothetical protein RJ640_008219 [Escallonia rubra]|uniref:DUF668 domain-containing protein n=1 Tax=Escallonia rubra TaxID=112253 RepID=A0AA88QQG7_9ASTE|nr:hypothetical protein RJ640_008219 [Escallonia rubra]